MSIGLLALLDDISVLLDDVASMTKVSMKKTAGILGDDLAVNAQQASGFQSSREIPLLWKITKGALLNKIIILPFAFLLSYYAPDWVIPTILVCGGVYLSFEGTEKVHEFLEKIIFKKSHTHKKGAITLSEKEKVKSAIFTDFILSIEIIILALSTVLEKSFTIQIIVVTIVALVAVLGVYGIVTLLVRMDDGGLYLMGKSHKGKLMYKLGETLVYSLPYIVKILGIVGTWAMLLVGGGIFTHNIPYIHSLYQTTFHAIPSLIFDTFLGCIVGYMFVIVFLIGRNKDKNGIIQILFKYISAFILVIGVFGYIGMSFFGYFTVLLIVLIGIHIVLWYKSYKKKLYRNYLYLLIPLIIQIFISFSFLNSPPCDTDLTQKYSCDCDGIKINEFFGTRCIGEIEKYYGNGHPDY